MSNLLLPWFPPVRSPHYCLVTLPVGRQDRGRVDQLETAVVRRCRSGWVCRQMSKPQISRSVQTMSYLGYRSPGGEEKSLCFSLPVIKTSHFLHLLLLLLLSLLLLPPGVLLLVSSPPLLPPSLLSLFSSLLLLCCVPLGWWGARSERPSLLAAYSVLLAVSILMQLGLAASAVLYRL